MFGSIFTSEPVSSLETFWDDFKERSSSSDGSNGFGNSKDRGPSSYGSNGTEDERGRMSSSGIEISGGTDGGGADFERTSYLIHAGISSLDTARFDGRAVKAASLSASLDEASPSPDEASPPPRRAGIIDR